MSDNTESSSLPEYALAISKDENHLLPERIDKVFGKDLEVYETVFPVIQQGHSGSVLALAVSVDGKYL